MFTPGSIVHGVFTLSATVKQKFAIILFCSSDHCIISTFTTSQLRSSSLNPVHGANPCDNPLSYVFKANLPIGVTPIGESFAFSKDTTVVTDYGYTQTNIDKFMDNVSELEKVCQLYPEEYKALIHALSVSSKTQRKYKRVFEEILKKLP